MEEKENKKIENSHRKHMLVFLLVLFTAIILSRFLPGILNLSERTVERTVLAGFFIFLVSFLFWLKKS